MEGVGVILSAAKDLGGVAAGRLVPGGLSRLGPPRIPHPGSFAALRMTLIACHTRFRFHPPAAHSPVIASPRPTAVTAIVHQSPVAPKRGVAHAASGTALPYTTSDARYTYVTTDGTLYLSEDRTYRVEVNSRVVDRSINYGQSVTDVGTGTYTLSGNRLTVYPDASSDASLNQTTTGTVSGSTVTVDVFQFARR